MSQSSPWDEAIAARLRAGDETALAAVYDQYGALVHGIARHLVGEDRANDITQDVFVSLWQRPENYDPERGGLRTFLAVIARRRALDELRSQQRRTARETRSADPKLVAVPNVEEAALTMLAAERIRGAVQGLSAVQRHAIELAYYQGLTFTEVAQATGTAEGTTKSRLRLALRHLAHELVEATNITSEERRT